MAEDGGLEPHALSDAYSLPTSPERLPGSSSMSWRRYKSMCSGFGCLILPMLWILFATLVSELCKKSRWSLAIDITLGIVLLVVIAGELAM